MLVQMAMRSGSLGNFNINPSEALDAHFGFRAAPLRKETSMGTEIYYLDFFRAGSEEGVEPNLECTAIIAVFVHFGATGKTGDLLLQYPLASLLGALFERKVPAHHPRLSCILPYATRDAAGSSLAAWEAEELYATPGNTHQV